MSNPTLIRVFRIPNWFPPGYRPPEVGQPVAPFIDCDWFHDTSQGGGEPMITTEKGRAELTEFIKQKTYYKPGAAYLVLCGLHTFTINYPGW